MRLLKMSFRALDADLKDKYAAVCASPLYFYGFHRANRFSYFFSFLFFSFVLRRYQAAELDMQCATLDTDAARQLSLHQHEPMHRFTLNYSSKTTSLSLSNFLMFPPPPFLCVFLFLVLQRHHTRALARIHREEHHRGQQADRLVAETARESRRHSQAHCR